LGKTTKPVEDGMTGLMNGEKDFSFMFKLLFENRRATFSGLESKPVVVSSRNKKKG
jgi:hypothetical protein